KPGKLTLTDLAAMKEHGEKIVMVTAYDAPGARLAEEAGIDILLVGDTAAMVVLGHDSTVPVTMDETLFRTRTVAGTVERTLALEAAGCFSVVLEAVPTAVAARITEALTVPTIGIGAGGECDGQVLVYHDLLGLTEGRAPRFVKRYAHLAESIRGALTTYAE